MTIDSPARPRYPHTFDNGMGEELTFDRRVTTADGERIEGTNRVAPGAGPPFHTHFLQEEGFTVLEGRLGYQLMGGVERFANAGEAVVFPPGVAHRFWNAGEGELRCRAYVAPPGNVEYFLGAIFAAQKKARSPRPALLDAAFFLWRYRSEFRMDAMPWIARSVVIPLVALFGHATGRYRRFAGAPKPTRR